MNTTELKEMRVDGCALVCVVVRVVCVCGDVWHCVCVFVRERVSQEQAAK